MSDTIIGSVIGALITGVISFLIFIAGNFSSQATLEKKTVETLSGYFDSVDQEMTYEDAIKAIHRENETLKNEVSSLEQQLSELNGQLDSKQAEIDRYNSIEEINKIIQTATTYWDNSDYEEALIILKNSKNKSPDIVKIYEQYSDDYMSGLLLQADALISERNYDGAVGVLEESESLVADSSLLKNKIDEIRDKPSALISDLVPVSGTTGEKQFRFWDVLDQDNYGNRYSSGICLKQEYKDKAHLVYALDNKYSILTGKFVLMENSKNTNGNYVLYAYTLADGETKLLYESQILATATRPIDIEIDVSNVMDLVLEVYDPNKTSNNAWTAFVDARLE